jgi:hypothetical protein
MSDAVFPGCMLAELGYLTEAFSNPDAGLSAHDSDELYMFIGLDPANPESLNAEISFRLENDALTLRETCCVFIPRGAAHGGMSVASLGKPVLMLMWHTSSDAYASRPAEASAPRGAYAANVITRYAPPSGVLPEAPDGFLELLLFLDGARLSGAPYLESMWFLTKNDTGPPQHAHPFAEIIGFAGTDAGSPSELGASVDFYIEGERVTLTKPTLIYIPGGVRHGPLIVPEMSRPIIHFSCAAAHGYARLLRAD